MDSASACTIWTLYPHLLSNLHLARRIAGHDVAEARVAMPRPGSSNDSKPDNSRFSVWFPVRYFQSIPAPIRSLSLGVLINRTGGYVTAFLALILSVRHASALQISLALIVTAGFAIAGSWCGGLSAARGGGRRTNGGARWGAGALTGR